MTENMGQWPSGHGQISKIWGSDRCGGTTIPTAMQFGYDRHESEAYLGNVGWFDEALAERINRRIVYPVPESGGVPYLREATSNLPWKSKLTTLMVGTGGLSGNDG